MRDAVTIFTLLSFILLITPALTSSTHQETGLHYCVTETDANLVNASQTDLSTCVEVLEPDSEAIHNLADYENDTIGYCCGATIDDFQEGSITRAYCLQEGGTSTAQNTDDNTKSEACTASSQTVQKTFTGYVINDSSGSTLPAATVTINYQYSSNGTDQEPNTTVETNTTGGYQASFVVPEEHQPLSSKITASKQICENTEEPLPTNNPVEQNITICTGSGEEGDDTGGDTTVCGNDVLEEGEACEPRGSQDPIFADDIPDTNNKVCLNNCQVEYEADSCDTASQCNPACCGSDICQDNNGKPKIVCQPQLCTNPSLDVYTSNLNVSDGTVEVDIGWQPPTECQVANSQLNIKDSNGHLIQSTLIDDKTRYTFEADATTLNDSETYTVTVQTQLSTTTVTNTTDFTPRIVCQGRADTTFCTYQGGDSGVMYCDEDLSADFQVCDDKEACYNPADGPANCTASRCETCSGPHSLYSSTALQPPEQSKICGEAFTKNLCYYEPASQRNTVRGQAEQCDNIRSCADYQSQQTCEGTPCNRSAAKNCEWNSLNEGLGKGFCSPGSVSDATPSLCHQCGFAGCDETLCENTLGSLGESDNFCYFNEDAQKSPSGELFNKDFNKYKCMAKPESGCATYDDKTACLSATGSESSIKLNGDYERVDKSNDYFGFGVCEYDDDLLAKPCFKDSNDNDQPDCPDRKSRCVSDLTPPTTTVEGITYGANISKSTLSALQLKATDNEYADDDLETTIEYNNTNYTVNPVTKLKNQIKASTDTQHTFTYWSKDPAQNLEPKQTFTFTVYEPLDDLLNLSTGVETFTLSGTTVANVTARVGDLPSNDPRELACTFKLQDQATNSVVDKTSASHQTTATTEMPYIDGGAYNMRANCFTDQGGSFTATKPLRVDTDPRITNTSPYGETFRAGGITLEAATNQTRRCQYRDTDGDWEDFQNTNSEQHSTTVNREAGDGVVTHDIRCTDDNGWIQGDLEDTIMYAIDDQPPTTNVNVTKNGEQITGSTVTANQVTAQMTCNDEPNLQYQNNNYSFGCAEPLQYCIGTQDNQCDPTNGEQATGPITIEAADNRSTAEQGIYPVETLYVVEEDNGGNRELNEVTIDLQPTYDLIPPTTTLENLPEGQRIMPSRILDANLTATDNNDTNDDITTYVAYNDKQHSEPNNLGWLKSQMQESQNDTHTFEYWSEDTAGNTETRKTATVELYTDYESELSLNLSTSLYNEDQDTFGRITASVGRLPTGDDRGVTCQFTQDNTTKTAQGSRAAQSTFEELPEGLHSVTANCTGDKGSSFTATKNAEIDLSPTIQNTTPYYEPVLPQQITISADTTNDRTCQYQRNGWQSFTQTGGREHTANITPQPGAGIVTHDIRCSDDEETWIYGGKTDKIAYGVDGDGPRTNITVTDPDGNTRNPDLPIIAEVVNVGFTCQDRPSQTENDEQIRFGCADVKYVCSGTAQNPCTPSTNDENVTTGTYELESREDQALTETVTILAEDKAGNTATTTHEVNLVDDSLDLDVQIQPR